MKNKTIKKIISLTIVSSMVLSFTMPIGTSYATTNIASDIEEISKSSSSNIGGENAILSTGGVINLNQATVIKTGDENGDDSDFYGTNAAILIKDGILNIENSNITTDGSHANAVFAYDKGVINISDSTIKTTKNNSGGVMVTGGGTITANNLTVTTDGNSSAPIRSDRGGGTLTVNGGTYTANGVGSPAIYSTADIYVNDAKLISTVSDGVVVEGKNSITLNNVNLTDNNTKNNKSDVYKNIFLYQSMSQDAEIGTAKFTAKDSTITTDNGCVIYVTNTTAVINLENNTFITNSDGGFLRAAAGAWGKEGSNGGKVTLIATNQEIEGDIFVDNISTLNMALRSGSSYEGTINAENSAKTLSLSISKDSKIKLTGDSYVTSLADEDSILSNIDFNGHTLYVNGKAITESTKSSVTLETYKAEVDLPAEESSSSSSGKSSDGRPEKPSDDGKRKGDKPSSNPDGNKGEPPAKPDGEEGKEPPKKPSGDMGEPPAKPDEDASSAKSSIWSNASTWAIEELNKAQENDLIPIIFNGADLTTNITRLEFAHIVVLLYEKLTGAPAKIEGDVINPFTDTVDGAVVVAYNLGITNGTSDTTFSPDALITREQMATMIGRCLECQGAKLSTLINTCEPFSDDSEMHDWSRNAIYFMTQEEVIKGVGDNKFDVKGNATREQALLISERSAEKFAK